MINFKGMKQSDQTRQSFINISAIVDELDNIELLPSFLSEQRHKVASDDDSNFSMRILTSGSASIERKLLASEVHPCGPEEVKGLDYIALWGSIPKPVNARKLCILKGEKILFEREIKEPKSVDLKPKIKNGEIRIKSKVEGDEPVQLMALMEFEKGKQLLVRIPKEATDYSEPLPGLPSGGKVRLRIFGTDGITSAELYNEVQEMEPTPPLGVIITPGHGQIFESSRPISLIANCYDAFGEKVSWKDHGISWRIDGKSKPKSQLDLITDLEPGKHKLELYSKKWKSVLDKVNVEIKKESDALKKQIELIGRASKYFKKVAKE